jgi:hypothetical protein
MIPPIPSRHDFIRMLREPPAWLDESLHGLSDHDLNATPLVGKWSYRGFILHIVGAAIGWTDILYRAVRPLRPQYGAWDPTWNTDFNARLATTSVPDAIAVLRENHAQVSAWVASMSDEDFLAEFPGVLWLADAGLRVVIADSGRWGLYLHPYYHLAFMQRHRVALGKPLPALERYLVRCPGFDTTIAWPPWTANA